MIFNPQKYYIEDKPEVSFIDEREIFDTLKNNRKSDRFIIDDIISKSLSKQRLNLEETATLINASDNESTIKIKDAAGILKNEVYGNRIVFFAPLYIGNKCTNDCKYCGFRTSNSQAERISLSSTQVKANVERLISDGHKRLILVFGEHPSYTPEFIAENVSLVYSVKNNNNSIRRVNINAAPFDTEGFKTIKKSGIGTYQIFQETYFTEPYKYYHAKGKKSDYSYRLTALDRAMNAGIDDVGLGILLGLYDWRYEVLGLIRHVNHLESCFGVGPHTLSFPRLQNALGAEKCYPFAVSDNDFTRLIAILRLAVPYTGMILTAREPALLREEALRYGISQIDAGTNIAIDGYNKSNVFEHEQGKEQFLINDPRSLETVIDEHIEKNMLPSFCTACYRAGRTGEHFMELSVPGFIGNFCTPNAVLTFAEYIEDFLPAEKHKKAYTIIHNTISDLKMQKFNTKQLEEKLEQIKQGNRDLYF